MWEEAGEALRARLRAGFNILIHCKGGLGRAGMIAARLLTELGVPPSQAIANTRNARPGAIETAAQEAFVHTIKSLPERPIATDDAACRARARGALLGLAIGDALGTTLEFTARDSTVRLTDMVGGGPFRLRPGQWTDDTAMALALADSLLDCGGLDETDLMQRFVEWHEQGRYSCTGRCFDIGITTRRALQRWKSTGNPVAGDSAPDSAGNGSLMRLAPVAVRYWRNRAALRDAAARQSRTTHAAPQAVEACVAYAELLADAISGASRAELLQPRAWNGDAAVATILAGNWRGKARASIKVSGYVLHSLEAALWSIGRSGSFEEAVLTAANLGEDADTTAAITGQLAGALYGVGAIPSAWRKKLVWHDEILGLADRLFDEG
jgi:ADP-ribosyl-[dinitrogen reductase] hydrolase